jgi:adenylate cyclase
MSRRVAFTRGERKRLQASVLLALGVGGLLVAAFLVGLGATARVGAGDLLFRARPARSARSTVLVGIDQRSHQALLPEYGPMAAWPRTLYARALDALGTAGPRVVALAIFFDAPKPGDGELADAMRRAGNVLTPVEAQGPKHLDPRPGVAQEFEVFVRPTRMVREAAAGEGLANITTARDSLVRGLPLVLRAGGEELPSLPLAIVARFARRPAVLDAPPTAAVVYAAGRAIPVTDSDVMLINFLGPPSHLRPATGPPGPGEPFRVISFVDVVEGRFDPGLVRDRIVLLGPTIRGVDEHPTPTTTDTRMSGVEILASAVETVLQQEYLQPMPPTVNAGLILLLALVGALAVAAWTPLPAALAVAATLALYLTLAAVSFEGGRILDLVYPPAGLFLAFAAALAYRVVFGEAQERMIRDAMARYLSPAVSRWVLEDPDRLRLGGELREMTVLFSDLRNFTTLAHALPPEILVSLLNTYRTEMTEIILRHDGVLAQYAGDAIEAFWNAPMNQSDHARQACQTALEMLGRMRQLAPDFAQRGWTGLDMGIGINTGRMVVGNMGSRNHLAYTAVGDPVNVASRLEGLSKEYGARIVVGEATRAAAGDAVTFRFLDVVAVKGRAEPLRVYEAVAPAGALAVPVARRLARYEEGIALYRARRWPEAAALFDTLAAEAPEDGPIALYRRRSRELAEDPPPADWNGVYVARTK